MNAIYLFDDLNVLHGPVDLPPVPGLGVQLPSNGIVLPEDLPEAPPGQVWALEGDDPQLIEDHRGPVYRTNDGGVEQFLKLGKLPPEYTTQPRPSAAHHWQDDAWVIDPLFLHTQKTLEINRDCKAVITSGFWSLALGAAHQYTSELDDQLNLTGAILAGLDSLYSCRDEQGDRAFRTHTYTQLRQVGDDFTAFKLQLLLKANDLKKQLDQALAGSDLAALEAVTWEDQPS